MFVDDGGVGSQALWWYGGIM